MQRHLLWEHEWLGGRAQRSEAPGEPTKYFFPAGTLKECNPDRVVLKKVVLSGYPVRVHKGKAVVRWMFHSADDVRWFRPLQLWTRRGRHGHIQVSFVWFSEISEIPPNSKKYS